MGELIIGQALLEKEAAGGATQNSMQLKKLLCYPGYPAAFAILLPCYPAWMVEREPIPVASPVFEGVVGKWEKI